MSETRPGGNMISELRYADNTVLLSNSVKVLEQLIQSVKKHSEDQNLFLNTKKIEIMSTDNAKSKFKITINYEDIGNVIYFEYVGSIINNNGDCTKQVRRLNKTFQRVAFRTVPCYDRKRRPDQAVP
uniref:Reverse transcriptase domain-containing protein n=2 Tax=Arion vulgaris TaxID=1028688 RepID=A0A0B7AF76_9EUPU